MLRVFPNLLGRVIRVTLSLDSHHSRIKIVGFPYNCKIVMADSELSCHIRLLLSFPVKLYSTPPPCRFHGTIMNERGGTVNLQSLHPYNHISSYYYML